MLPIIKREFWSPQPELQREFDILFIDTEFSRLQRRGEGVWAWAQDADLLSVGISALGAGGPPGFYAIRELTPDIRGRCSPFVVTEVLPHLHAVEPMLQFSDWTELKAAIGGFLADRYRASGKHPAFAVDWAGDAWLLDPAMPAAAPWILLEDFPGLPEALDGFFNEDFVRHNAFNEALALRHGYLELPGP